MAELIRCATCDRELRPTVRFCPGCRQDPRALVQRATRIADNAESLATAVAVANDGLACNRPGCEGSVVARAGDLCQFCQRPVGAIPWRLIGLDTPLQLSDGEQILLGRAEGPATSALLERTNVSKRHAWVRAEGCDVWVTDLDSLNGTFIDGRRLRPGCAERVSCTAELRLAADVVLTLEREA